MTAWLMVPAYTTPHRMLRPQVLCPLSNPDTRLQTFINGSFNRLCPSFTSRRPSGPYPKAGGCVPRYAPFGRTRDGGRRKGENPVSLVLWGQHQAGGLGL